MALLSQGAGAPQPDRAGVVLSEAEAAVARAPHDLPHVVLSVPKLDRPCTRHLLKTRCYPGQLQQGELGPKSRRTGQVGASEADSP